MAKTYGFEYLSMAVSRTLGRYCFRFIQSSAEARRFLEAIEASNPSKPLDAQFQSYVTAIPVDGLEKKNNTSK